MSRRSRGVSGSGERVRSLSNARRMLEESKTASDSCEDMVMLSSVTPDGIARNLMKRHAADQIYTNIGNVLIVVNPFKWLDIYGPSYAAQYVRRSRTDVPPHVFMVAEEAYRTMVNEDESQCVIISGESGAGKTEAAKQILNFVAVACGQGDAVVEHVKNVVLDSNPLLEAFGNAMTLRNNNSSRFGKYMEILFDRQGQPRGGRVSNYLLEKSRLRPPTKGERAFHIFYQLIAGAPKRAKAALKLGSASKFKYLSRSDCLTIDNDGGKVDDKKEFQATLKALKTIGVGKGTEQILQVVAAVLHLGNVGFTSASVGGGDGTCIAAGGGARDALAMVVQLLKLDAEGLEAGLTQRTLSTMAAGGKRETYQVPLNMEQARAARDTLAKAVYSRLFDFLVGRVNAALELKSRDGGGAGASGEDEDEMPVLGVLDIYGFEVFKKNGFEQFCINFVNEKLQQIFILLTLAAEQDEYQAEGIEWEPIPFFNNRIVCDLIESKKVQGTVGCPGIFHILDDTTKSIHGQSAGVDERFLEKLNIFHKAHDHYQSRSQAFVVRHYAGDVEYDVEGFCAANKDQMSDDIKRVVCSSASRLVRTLFADTKQELAAEAETESAKVQRTKKATAGSKIRSQAASLVDRLMDCNPHYVRCLKSNDCKRANLFDKDRVLHQIQYLGLLENVKVRRAGFAYRAEFHRFTDRFKMLATMRSRTPGALQALAERRGVVDETALASMPDRDACDLVVKVARAVVPALGAATEVQLGKFKIFIRRPETLYMLEQARDRHLHGLAVLIQQRWRAFAARKHLVKLRLAIVKLFAKNGKTRSRDSVYRPYAGHYVQGTRREEIQRIVGFCERCETARGDIGTRAVPAGARAASERLLFSDDNVVRIEGFDARSGAPVVTRVVVALTTKALYVLGSMDGAKGASVAGGAGQKASGSGGRLVLLRRHALDDIEGLVMSQHPDHWLTIRVTPQTPVAAPDVSHWKEDKDVPCCMETGKKFGVFVRRHHCRFTGNVYCSDVCNGTAVLPDLGYYAPVRVHHSVAGRVSCDPVEDVVLVAANKGELVATICDQCRSRAAKLVTFSDEHAPRRAGGALERLSRAPMHAIHFIAARVGSGKASSTSSPGSKALHSLVVQYDYEIGGGADGPVVAVKVPEWQGVSDRVVQGRMRREKDRRLAVEETRRREHELRTAKSAERDAQRREQQRARAATRRERRRQRKAGNLGMFAAAAAYDPVAAAVIAKGGQHGRSSPGASGSGRAGRAAAAAATGAASAHATQRITKGLKGSAKEGWHHEPEESGVEEGKRGDLAAAAAGGVSRGKRGVEGDFAHETDPMGDDDDDDDDDDGMSLFKSTQSKSGRTVGAKAGRGGGWDGLFGGLDTSGGAEARGTETKVASGGLVGRGGAPLAPFGGAGTLFAGMSGLALPTGGEASGVAGEGDGVPYERLRSAVSGTDSERIADELRSEGKDLSRLETYLGDADFFARIEVTKARFEELPKWMQVNRRRKAGLEYKG